MAKLMYRERGTKDVSTAAGLRTGRVPVREINPVWPNLAMRIQRNCACGGVCPKCRQEGMEADLAIQAKLIADEPGASYEQEADRIADTAMHTTVNDGNAPIAAVGEFNSLSGNGSIQRQTPPAPPPPGAAAQNCAKTTEPVSRTETMSERFYISEVTPPCLSCPNSPASECPKLGDWFATGPVQFSWQARFGTYINDEGFIKLGLGKKTHVIQKIEKAFNFATAPANGYAYTSPYWEAFAVGPEGTTAIDYWQFDLPDGSSGEWSMTGAIYLTSQLPDGMAVGNVADAGNLPSTKDEPKGLGRVVCSRSIQAKFDFTGTTKKHHQ